MNSRDYRDDLIEMLADSEVALRRELREAQTDAESWRLVALASMVRVTDLQRELDMIDRQSYVFRTRTQDRLDVFLDQRDLRLAEAA